MNTFGRIVGGSNIIIEYNGYLEDLTISILKDLIIEKLKYKYPIINKKDIIRLIFAGSVLNNKNIREISTKEFNDIGINIVLNKNINKSKFSNKHIKIKNIDNNILYYIKYNMDLYNKENLYEDLLNEIKKRDEEKYQDLTSDQIQIFNQRINIEELSEKKYEKTINKQNHF